ncbi:MAG: GumC family protein, partial [Acidobacteriota bacterium]
MAERSIPGEPPARDLREGVSVGALMDVLRRRKLLVIVPTLLATAAAVGVAYLLPPRYRSQALVVHDPGDVRKAPATGASEDLPARLGEIKEVLHSRGLLTRLAVEEGLVSENPGTLPDALLAKLRSGIFLEVEGERSLAIGFEAEAPERAHEVASGLVRLFLETTRTEREQRAAGRAEFLEARLQDVEARLGEQRSAIEEYKERWFEEIPEQAETNLRYLTSAQERLQDLESTIDEEEARLAAIRREMSELESQGVTMSLGKSPAESRLEDLRMELRQLRRRYTDQHPDVVRARAELEELEAAIEEGSVGSVAAPEYSGIQLRYLELGAEREAIEQRLTRLRDERSSVRSEIATFRGRAQSAPHHETVLADMERDLESTQEQY